MPYPVSYQKTRTISKPVSLVHYRQDFFEKISGKLEDNGLSTRLKDDHTLTFRGPLFRFAWNGFSFLNGITQGRIHLSTGENQLKIHYSLYFYEALLLAAFFTLIPAFFYFMPSYAAGIFLIIWGVLFTGNYVFAFLHFNALIRHITRKLREHDPGENALG